MVGRLGLGLGMLGSGGGRRRATVYTALRGKMGGGEYVDLLGKMSGGEYVALSGGIR